VSAISTSGFRIWGIDELLKTYSGISIRPSVTTGIRLVGDLKFCSELEGFEQITDSYKIDLRIPQLFPDEVPRIFECGGRIPESFHTNSDGTLCLGSPIRIFLTLRDNPTLIGFVNYCVIPFLYGYSYFERNGVLPQGELAHGEPGLIQDYMTLFGVKDENACRRLVKLLGMKKRLANKYPCPCGSGRRVGKCHNGTLNFLRRIGGRAWLRKCHPGLTD